MELDNSKMFDKEDNKEKDKNNVLNEKMKILNEIKLQQLEFQKIVEEGRKANAYNSTMDAIIHEQKLFDELNKIPQSQLSSSDKFSKIRDIKDFLDKDLLSKVKATLSTKNIDSYIAQIHLLTENCYKDDLYSIFETKINAFASILECKKLTTENLNLMAQCLLDTSIYDKRKERNFKYSSAILDSNSQKSLQKIFSHHLFSNNKNEQFMPILYGRFVKNVTNPKRKFKINFSLSYADLNNRNYQKYLNGSAISPVLNQFKNESIIFDCFLKNNIKYVENFFIEKQSCLNYLVDNTRGSFAYQELVDVYLKNSKKMINQLDNNFKRPVEYAKKNSNFFFYENNPIYKVLIKHGATPIKNHSLDLIKKGMNSIKNKEKQDVITYEKQETPKTETQLMHETMTDNVKNIKISLSELKLKEEEKIFLMLGNILALSMELTTESNKMNVDEKYLFIKKSTLEYLPAFTHDFIHGLKLAPLSEKPLFIEEYSKQIELFHQKVLDNYEVIIKNESDNKFDVMKKNTAFLTSKM
jgi:hypothetical protein